MQMMSGTNKQTKKQITQNIQGTTYVESSNDDIEEKGGNILPTLASKIQIKNKSCISPGDKLPEPKRTYF